MAASRLYALFKNIPQLSHQKLRKFCSCSAGNPGLPRFVSDDVNVDGSSIYRHALKFQRPTTMEWRDEFQNSVRFIGSVCRPLEKRTTRDGVCVFTVLSVKTFREPRCNIRVLLNMRDRIAEISFKHLKPDDLIYVSGNLGFYMKTDGNGDPRPCYKVIVEELNYVAECGRPPSCKRLQKSESGEYADRIHLWQVFFCNPSEWWDRRKHKKHEKQPDFQHKHTSEALWIRKGDPAWVRKQLQLHDTRMTELGQRHTGVRTLSPLFV